LWLNLLDSRITAMTGIIILAVLALAVIAALQPNHRRNVNGPEHGPYGSSAAEDRDLARTKLDLLALGGAAEPFSHKPISTSGGVMTIRQARLFSHAHGRHAA
jgi:hypothetical protein